MKKQNKILLYITIIFAIIVSGGLLYYSGLIPQTALHGGYYTSEQWIDNNILVYSGVTAYWQPGNMATCGITISGQWWEASGNDWINYQNAEPLFNRAINSDLANSYCTFKCIPRYEPNSNCVVGSNYILINGTVSRNGDTGYYCSHSQTTCSSDASTTFYFNVITIETSVIDTPIDETPVIDIPIDETPVIDTPIKQGFLKIMLERIKLWFKVVFG